MSHDQNFKNLILDYPHQALAFFAPDEAADGLPGAKIVPVRQEQLKGFCRKLSPSDRLRSEMLRCEGVTTTGDTRK